MWDVSEADKQFQWETQMVALFVDTVISFTKLRIPWVSSMNTADPTVMTMSTFTGAMLKAVGIEPP